MLASIKMLAQENSTHIKALLNTDKKLLQIQQEIVFFNDSDSTLNKIILHNWANSFKNRKTPLSRRFIENFNKELYFAKESELGYSKINNISSNFNTLRYSEDEQQPDILKVTLQTPLKPNSSVTLNITYVVKIPAAKFTGYGFTKNGYNLRYWYITPAIYQNGWQKMSNLNLDDLYENNTNFNIEITIPKNEYLESSAQIYKTFKNTKNTYFLKSEHSKDIIINIQKNNPFKTFYTDKKTIVTNVLDDQIDDLLTKDVLNRELKFLEEYLGPLPLNKIFIDKTTQSKNPVYGLSQLPKIISPFSDVFKYDLTLFKALSNRYLKQTLLLNERTDYWLLDGLQKYLMMEYVTKFYPEIKVLGKVSDSWFLKKYNISKLEFNEKYPFVYQFTARKFLDQSLTTRADSLSNFNRKIVSKYKAGLGLNYLKGYLGEAVLNNSIKEFYQQNKLQKTTSKQFREILTKKTTKKIDWFFEDYLQTNKKIDYTLKKVAEKQDSIYISINNNRNITTPIALYGIKNDSIQFKKWYTNVNAKKVVAFGKGEFEQFALNYENIYPEYNTLDNYYNTTKKLFNKPLKFTLIKDIQAPDYNQIFYQPIARYNFYDGLTMGVKLHNMPIIKRNLEFKLSPAYATKSNMINGAFSVLYNQFYEKTKLYKITYGIVGNTQQYAPELSYSSLIPYVDFVFKRKSLRDASSEFLTAKMVHINKEVAPNIARTDQDNYSIFSVSYNYIFPDIIDEVRYRFNTEFANKFSKISADFRYRKLTSSDTQLDFRVFAGAFLHNSSEGNYFSFGLDRANDYLFELGYYGRSESTGIFSQQFIITEGGFKSVLPKRFANQYMLSLNSSIGLWKWVEFYNGVAFLKSKNEKVFFGYENGIRLNFIHNIFELYFPLHSNNGWEISQQSYYQKIRFTFTGDFNRVYNFFRRGFF